MSQYPELYNDSRWRHPKRGLRILKLRTDPLCWYCQQARRLTPADTVDHIKPHRGDPDLFFDWDNLRSCCKACHDAIAQAKDNQGFAPGVGVDGMPLDDGHPWVKQ